jgi:hypothetical protein
MRASFWDAPDSTPMLWSSLVRTAAALRLAFVAVERAATEGDVGRALTDMLLSAVIPEMDRAPESHVDLVVNAPRAMRLRARPGLRDAYRASHGDEGPAAAKVLRGAHTAA